MKKILIFFIILLPFTGTTQEEKKFGRSFSGLLETGIFYDSRETADVREGHFFLFQKNENLHPDGNDLNANPKFETSCLPGTVSFNTGKFRVLFGGN